MVLEINYATMIRSQYVYVVLMFLFLIKKYCLWR